MTDTYKKPSERKAWGYTHEEYVEHNLSVIRKAIWVLTAGLVVIPYISAVSLFFWLASIDAAELSPKDNEQKTFDKQSKQQTVL